MAFHDFAKLVLVAKLFVVLGLVQDIGGNGIQV